MSNAVVEQYKSIGGAYVKIDTRRFLTSFEVQVVGVSIPVENSEIFTMCMNTIIRVPQGACLNTVGQITGNVKYFSSHTS